MIGAVPRTMARTVALVMVIAACSSTPERHALTFSPDALPDGRVGEPYEQRIEIGQNVTPVGGMSAPAEKLPPGLKVEKIEGSANAGRIVGTPTTAGTSTFEVFVWCFGTNVNGQTGTKQYSLTVR
jgi:hypothetical protein